MAMKLYSDTDISNIATKIRAKNGTATTYKVSEMSTAINNLQCLNTDTTSGTSSMSAKGIGCLTDYSISGGASQRTTPGNNLWGENWENGYYNRTTGEKGSGTNYIRCMDYIPITPGTSIYFTKPSDFTNYAIIWYTSSKTIVESASTYTASASFTAPSTAYYFTFYGDTGTSGATYNYNVMINKGTTALPYEAGKPYGTPSPDNPVDIEAVGEYDSTSGKYRVDVVSVGKNLFNGSIELGSINSSDGTLAADSTRTRSVDFIPVLPNTTYTLTRTKVSSYRWVIGYTSAKIGITDGNFLGRPSALEATDYAKTSITFTTSATTYYVKWFDTVCTDTNEQVQIEEGRTATTYEPYTSLTTPIYLDKPLYKIGNVSDYIDFEEGKVVRYCGEVTLTGASTENWTYELISGYDVFKYLATDMLDTNIGKGLCSYYKNWDVDYSGAGDGIVRFGWVNQQIYFYNNTTRFSGTLANYKTWLASNNVKVVYQLASSTEENINLPNIPLFNNITTYIEVDNATSMSGEFFKVV